jgi:hypothetical protein
MFTTDKARAKMDRADPKSARQIRPTQTAKMAKAL